jgi:tellurite resistance protein
MTTWPQRTCILLIIAFCLLNCDIAWGRAGGGGGFAGGGGGGGGGFSGGGGRGFGGGSGTNRPVSTTMTLITLIPFIVIIVIQMYEESVNPDRVFSNDGVRSNRMDQVIAQATIQAADPDFDTTSFLSRFSAAFHQIQNAWQQQNMQPVQHFVSDSIFERFTLQIQEQQDMDYRDQMEHIQIRSASLAEANASHVFDVLTVQITASAIDYRVSIETGKYLSGNRTADTFTEFWSFIRRRGVQTESAKPGLIEGHCPNCGDSIRINQLEKCKSCDAVLRSGEYDWVLAEITQACVWRPHSLQVLGKAQSYRERRDPGFNIQHMEDRASVIFWRKAMADRLGKIKPLLKMATNEICREYETGYVRDGKKRERAYSGGCSVGSVELRGFVEAEESDYVLVEIHWSANKHGAGPDGRIIDHGHWRRFRSLFVLMRSKGVQTNSTQAVVSAHCPTCGAPESDVVSHACEFCDTVLNDGRQDWVLSAFHMMNSEAAQIWLTKANFAIAPVLNSGTKAPAVQRRETLLSHADVLAWTIGVFASDGVIDNRERQVILQLAKKDRMTQPMVNGLIKCALAGKLEAQAPPTLEAGRIWMEQMADVALLDGKVQPDERATLIELGKKAGLIGIDVNLLINKRRAERRRQTRIRQSVQSQPSGLHQVQKVLLEALYCITASDLRILKTEQAALTDVLSKVGAPLTSEAIEASIEDFVARIKKVGVRQVLNTCTDELRSNPAVAANKGLFLRAFAIVAAADGAIGQKEAVTIEELTAAIIAS